MLHYLKYYSELMYKYFSYISYFSRFSLFHHKKHMSKVKHFERLSIFFFHVSNIINLIVSSYKRMSLFREKQKKYYEHFNMNRQSDTGLNQKLTLKRVDGKRWSFHYNCLLNLVILFPSIINIFDDVIQREESIDHKREASIFLSYMQYVFWIRNYFIFYKRVIIY